MARLGIIAGGGGLPRKLIDTCKREGRNFFVLAFKGQTDPALVEGIPHFWAKLGATGSAISILKKENVDTLVMAGAIRRPSLAELKPDWRTIQIFARLGAKAFGDDALLRAIADEIESNGFKVVGAHEVAPEIITPAGILGKRKPDAGHAEDMDIAIRTAKTLGALDIGQAAIVQQGIVLGVEAVEGTDALIARCRILKRKGRGGVLVKSCKPQQDQRLDLPTIGMRTVRNAFEAGLEGIAVEAGASIILDRENVVDAADKLGIFIAGFNA
jgi:UDP-2,3-diacylglucosamine hydrolase